MPAILAVANEQHAPRHVGRLVAALGGQQIAGRGETRRKIGCRTLRLERIQVGQLRADRPAGRRRTVSVETCGRAFRAFSSGAANRSRRPAACGCPRQRRLAHALGSIDEDQQLRQAASGCEDTRARAAAGIRRIAARPAARARPSPTTHCRGTCFRASSHDPHATSANSVAVMSADAPARQQRKPVDREVAGHKRDSIRAGRGGMRSLNQVGASRGRKPAACAAQSTRPLAGSFSGTNDGRAASRRLEPTPPAPQPRGRAMSAGWRQRHWRRRAS